MIQHREEVLRWKHWITCSLCAFACKGPDLVQYYKKDEASRNFTGTLSAPEEEPDLAVQAGVQIRGK